MQVSPTADACWGRSANVEPGSGGNATEDALNNNVFLGDPTNDPTTLGIFDTQGWTLAQKTDGAGSINVSLSVSGLNATSGTWSLDTAPIAGFDSALIVLKGSNNMAAYLFTNVLDVASGSFNMGAFPNPSGKNNQDLSNFSVYVSGDLAPIPLPGAAWLMLTGLAGFFGFRARRRKAAAAA